MATFRNVYKIRDHEIVVRNAEPEDAAAMIAMVHQFDSETAFLAREPGEFAMTEESERALIEARKAAPNFRFSVIEVDGRLCGMCDASYSLRARYRHTGEMSIAILKAYWGFGAGRAAMETNIAWLRDHGVEKIGLTVDTQNLRALSLYQRLGFVIEGTSVGSRKLSDGTYHDSYRMALNLPRG